MKKLCDLYITVALLAASALAQSAPNVAQPFALTLSPISLPGNHQTIVGTESGMAFTPTPNFDLLEKNVLAPADSFQYFGGGLTYRLPVLSTKLNNASPYLNGFKFQFALTGSVGVDRLAMAQHWAYTAGGSASYFLSGRWAFAGQVEYGHFPGFNNSAILVSLGPQFHF